MPNDQRTPEEIERDVERQRSELSGTIDEIRSRFTPEAVFREIQRSFGEHGSDMGRAVERSVKQNPMALALTGVGLAWMIFGRSHDDRPSSSRGTARSYTDDDLSRATYDPYTGAEGYGSDRYEHREGGRALRGPDPVGNGGNAYPGWVETGDLHSDPFDDPMGDPLRDAEADAGTARPGMGEGATVASTDRNRSGGSGHGASDSMRSASSSMRNRMGSMRQSASERRRAAAERASRVRDQLSHGTEKMSETARERVMAARERAMAARYQAGRSMQQGWERGRDSAVDFFEDQPLIAGALALAAGAAIAGAIPRTRMEDEWMGEESDRLIAEAERIFHEERHKAERVGQAAMDEARNVAGEKGQKADSAAQSAVKTASDEVRDAAGRVRSAAEQEADRQKLGKPNG